MNQEYILKNYNDERVRRFILKHAKIRAVVSLSGEMFKPFTNTKTCLLFVERREVELKNIADAVDDSDVLYAVTQLSGKNRSGNLVRDKSGQIVSDLPEISDFLKKNISWGA